MDAPQLGDDYSLNLCQQIASWRYEDLPQNVIHTLKGFILDTLGVIAGASNAPGIGELNQRLARWEKTGSATGLIGMRRYSPPTAAMANGAAAHALDFDDQHDPARVHTNCVVLPALLATAEDIGTVSGKDFLVGYAIGAEVHARLGLACNSSIAPRLASDDGLRHARREPRRRRGCSTSTPKECAMHSAWRTTRRAAPRKACATACFPSGWARASPRATPSWRIPRRGRADGHRAHARRQRRSLRPLRARRSRARSADRGLGEAWQIPEYSFKPWPGCRCHHAAVGLGIRLHRQGVKAADVKGVEIGLGRLNWLTVGAPYDPSIASVTHAQFNAAYSFARALTDARLDLHSYQPHALGDPAVVSLAARTRVIDDPSIEPASQGARAAVTLASGETLEVRADVVKGSPHDPMSEAELVAKFRGCFEFGMRARAARVDRLADVVMNLKDVPAAAREIVTAFPG